MTYLRAPSKKSLPINHEASRTQQTIETGSEVPLLSEYPSPSSPLSSKSQTITQHPVAKELTKQQLPLWNSRLGDDDAKAKGDAGSPDYSLYFDITRLNSFWISRDDLLAEKSLSCAFLITSHAFFLSSPDTAWLAVHFFSDGRGPVAGSVLVFEPGDSCWSNFPSLFSPSSRLAAPRATSSWCFVLASSFPDSLSLAPCSPSDGFPLHL